MREVPGAKHVCAVLCHGITADREEDGVFTRLAESLGEAGIPSFRFDFRGHGKSGGKFPELTIGGEAQDLAGALDFLKGRGYARFAVVAASFAGGAASLVVPRRQDVAALVLWNAVVDYALTPALVEASRTCRLVIGGREYPMSSEVFAEMQGFRPADSFAGLRIPVLLVHGDKDDLVPYAGSVELAKRIPGAELATVRGAGHGFHAEPGTGTACMIAADFLSKNPG